MSKVWYCLLSLLLANLIIEYWREVPNYETVAKITWEQMWALVIYYFIWEEKNVG